MPDPDHPGIADDIAEIVDLALDNTVVRDRFTGTAVLTHQQAADIGALGYVARASGLRTTPARPPDHRPPSPGRIYTGGDVLARFLIRAEEIAATAHSPTSLRRHTPAKTETPHAGRDPHPGRRRRHRRRLARHHHPPRRTRPDGTLTRVKIVDPSFFNWPALPVALADTIVPDFPLANKSFNLSYAGNDL